MTDEGAGGDHRRVGPLGIALVLGLLPALGLAATVAVKQVTAPRRPAATAPQPTQFARPLHPALHSTVAAGVDVVYWANWDGVHGAPYRLHAVDWSGHDAGTVDLPATTDASRGNQQPVAIPAPDGRSLLVDGDVYSAGGQWLGSAPSGQTLWADDSRHLCHLTVSNDVQSVRVDLLATDGTLRSSASAPTTGAAPSQAITLLSCSATAMRADVLVSADRQDGHTTVLQLDLRSGGLGAERTVCDGICAASVVASPDGSLLAYDDTAGQPVLTPIPSGDPRTISLLATPLLLSGPVGADALLLQLRPPLATTVAAHVPGLELLDLHSGGVEWSRPDSNTIPQWAATLSGGRVIAVAACQYAPASAAFPSGPCRLDIVSGATAVSGGVGLDEAFGWGPF